MLKPITVRVGSQMPLDFHLRTDTNGDGIDDAPLALTGAVELRLKRADGQAFVFATTDTPVKLLYVMNASEGHVQFRPLVGTWATGARYFTGVFWLTDYQARKIPYPVGEEYLIHVREN